MECGLFGNRQFVVLLTGTGFLIALAERLFI